MPHSKIVLANLLSVANEQVQLFWRTFDQPVWKDEEVYNAVIDAIERGVNFKVAVQRDSRRESTTEEILLDYRIPI